MPIAPADLQLRLSGGAANSDPNLSLGGAMSSVALVSASLHNLFDVVSSAEATAGDTEYRGFYVRNNHATLSWTACVVWIESDLAGGGTYTIALADEAVNSAMETIANESTAPVGPSFTAPSTKATGLSIGTIPAQQYKGIWVRCIVPANAPAQALDNVQIRIEGDTAA